MNLFWTQNALNDLLEMRDYLDAHQPGTARALIERIRKQLEVVKLLPRCGRRVPELNHDNTREIIVRRYRVVYRLMDESIHVLTVRSSYRLLDPADLP